MIEEMPSVEELVQSVLGLLKQEILPATEQPELKYKLQVACNVLSIVQRELILGVDCASDERAILDSFLNCEGENLAQMRERLSAKIRSGELDSQVQSLAEQLLPAVASRLAIDNPQYSTLAALKNVGAQR